MTATLAERVRVLEDQVAHLTRELERRPAVTPVTATTARQRWAEEHGIDLDEFEDVDVSEYAVSARAAAAILGLSIEHVHRLVAEGKIVGERRRGRGGSILSRSSVEAYRAERAALRAS